MYEIGRQKMRTHSHTQKPSLINAPSFFSTLVALLLIVAGSGYAQQEANKLFQSGLYQEEAKGDLGAAIQIYQQILKDYSGDRPACAKALLQIGGCNEKLGRSEAQKAYQRVIAEYPGQKPEVTIAKERIAELSKIFDSLAHKPTFGKIQIPTKPGNGVLSPDGKKLAFVSKRSIWVVPVQGKVSPDIAGEPVTLPGTEGAWRWGMSWSADGKWIAYNILRNNRANEIHVISSTGGEPKKITVSGNRGNHVLNYRLSLSPDGKVLAFTSKEEDGTNKPQETSIYTIPVDGGIAKRLTAPGTREPAFSPDGKKIAYVKEGRLWVIPASGGTPVLCSDQPGSGRGPVWSPDGKMIAFNHEPGEDNESNEIWIVPVSEDGKAAAAPTKIKLPLSTYDFLAGWTSDNKIGLNLQNPPHRAIYTVPASGGNAVQVTPAGWPFHPRWSPDGKRIFFRCDGIASVPSEGGEISIGPLDADSKISEASPGGGNAVSPDGEKIVFSGVKAVLRENKKAREVDIYTIPIEGGEPTKLTISPGQDRFPCWSPDGKKIAFIRYGHAESSKEMSICIVPREGGEVRQLTSKSHRVLWSTIAWSPDGKSIAYFSDDKAIKVMPVQGGESRVVVKVEDVSAQSELTWSRDGKKIAYSSRGRIWVVSLDGGEPEEVKTGLDAKAFHISLSPDGGKIAFTAMGGGDTELWLISDFLPPEKMAQKTEPEGISIKQIWKSPHLEMGTVSSDGRFLSDVDWGTGDVAVHNLITGEKQILTHEAGLGDSTHFAEYTVISKNGKKIAYSWWNPHNTNDLRLIDVDNPSPSLLYGKEGEGIHPITWLSDKELIALRSIRETKTTQMVSFHVLDKTEQILKTFKGAWPQVSCSPDEKYLAYDFPNETDNGNHDINIMLANGDEDISLISHPANDRVLGWVPGRKAFLFTSDRSGSWDLWAIPLDDGKPSGPAKKIYTNIGRVQPRGFTDNGNCYFGFSRRNFSTYLTPFNAENGEVNEKKGRSLLGSNFSVKWSPDGQSLAYISEGDPKSENPCQLTIKDLRTGQERKLATNLFLAASPCWSPDGNSIIVLGREKSKLRTKGYKGDVFLVDVKTGQTTEILHLSDYKFKLPDDMASPLSDLEWSADGKSFYYLFFKDRLVKHDLETGEDKVLYKQAHFDRGSLSRSPDGKMLIFAARSPEEKKSRLFTIPVEGGQAKELCTPQEADYFLGASWSPDGKYIYFGERQEGTHLWRISAEGDTPQKIWHSENGAGFLSLHPDGNQIAFSIRERITEIRAIQNLGTELSKVFKKNE
jgi:Tol biopolymer transport system component